MPSLKPRTAPAIAAAPTLAEPSPRRRHPGHPPAFGPGPIYVGGVELLDHAHGGRMHREADARGAPARGRAREPWPEEVYERRRLEQADFLIALRAGIEADVRLGEEIRDLLDGHEGIDAATIIVVTECGEVTLYGLVDDDESRQLAADLVEPLWGVTAVHNFLRVRH